MKTKKTSVSTSFYTHKPKKRRKGIHAKTQSSKNKHSKNYAKRSVGQG